MKRYDLNVLFIILLIIIFITILSIVDINLFNKNSFSSLLIVEEKGKEIARINLPSEQKYYSLVGEWGNLILEIEGVKVRIAPSSKHYCPDKICMKKGWIGNLHESIICLPNQIVVYYEGKRTFDGITY